MSQNDSLRNFLTILTFWDNLNDEVQFKYQLWQNNNLGADLKKKVQLKYYFVN